jgi:hypothetical protein
VHVSIASISGSPASGLSERGLAALAAQAAQAVQAAQGPAGLAHLAKSPPGLATRASEGRQQATPGRIDQRIERARSLLAAASSPFFFLSFFSFYLFLLNK